MNFLKQFFGSSNPAPSDTTGKEVCQFTIEDGECSLVQQLKQKQAEKRELDTRIKNFEEPVEPYLRMFTMFLGSMENCGFEMNTGYRSLKSSIRRELSTVYGLCKLQGIIGRMTDTQLEDMFQELREIKYKERIVSNLKQQSASLGGEIAELKTKLGIE